MHRETDADGAEREVRETSGESILESIREAPRSREMASALRRVAARSGDAGAARVGRERRTAACPRGQSVGDPYRDRETTRERELI